MELCIIVFIYYVKAQRDLFSTATAKNTPLALKRKTVLFFELLRIYTESIIQT